jgi:hypothetical protein
MWFETNCQDVDSLTQNFKVCKHLLGSIIDNSCHTCIESTSYPRIDLDPQFAYDNINVMPFY